MQHVLAQGEGLAVIKKRLEIEDLRALGLDTRTKSRNALGNLSFEAPARTNRASFIGKCHVGAFTYFADGKIYTTDFGRYCSIAAGVTIGHSNHPTKWVSTNPFQYQQSFRFNMEAAVKWDFRAEYENDKVNPSLTKKASSEVQRRTLVGNDVWIGTDVKIIAGVTIGDGAIIGAGAVVTKDVRPYEIVGGVPARKIGDRFDDVKKEKLLSSKWWDYAPWQLRHIDFSNVDDALQEIESMRVKKVLPYSPGVVLSG